MLGLKELATFVSSPPSLLLLWQLELSELSLLATFTALLFRNGESWMDGDNEEATLVSSCRLRNCRRRPRCKVLPFANGESWTAGEKDDATLVSPGSSSESELRLWSPY